MRVWARFGILAMLSVAVLAGWGADWVLGRVAKGRWVWASVMALLLLIDFAVLPYPYGYTEVRGQPVDEWLAARSGVTPIIQYPLDKTWYGWALYQQRVHGQPIAYGYGTFTPKAYSEACETLSRWPSEETLDLLRRWGVVYALVGERSYGSEWPALHREMEEMPGLEEVAVYENRPLYHGDRLLKLLPPRPDVPSTELINGPQRAYLEDRVHVYAIK